MIDLVERTVLYAFETCNVDHSMAFVNGVLCRALKSLLVSILKDKSGIGESFESAIVQMATGQIVVSRIRKEAVTNTAEFAPSTKFAVEAVKNGVV